MGGWKRRCGLVGEVLEVKKGRNEAGFINIWCPHLLEAEGFVRSVYQPDQTVFLPVSSRPLLIWDTGVPDDSHQLRGTDPKHLCRRARVDAPTGVLLRYRA